MADATLATNPSMMGGTRSVVGRATARSVHRLKKKVQEEFEAIDARDKAAIDAREARPPEVEQPDPESVSGFFMARALGKSEVSKGRDLSKTQRETLLEKQRLDSPTGRKMRLALGLTETTPLEARTRTRAEVEPVSPKMSPSFTCQGKEGSLLGEKSRTLLKRFFHAGVNEQLPELGRYDVDSPLVQARVRSWDFKEREAHPSRKLPFTGTDEQGNYLVSPPSTVTPDPDMFFRSTQRSGDSLSGRPAPDMERMGLWQTRPETLAWSMRDGYLKMTDLQTRPEDLGDHDLSTSHARRPANFDFRKPQGRSDPAKETHYEAGKYKVERAESLTCSSPKTGLDFHRHLPRSRSGPGGHFHPPEILAEDSVSSLKSVSLDRSLYRGTALSGAIHMPRTLCVRDFEQYSDRPSIIKKTTPMYDESDPAAVAAVYQRVMSYDADTSDMAITVRRDVAPNMSRALTRQRGDYGSRMFQEDQGMRGSKGFSFQDTSVCLQPLESKEPRGIRADCGLREFDRVKGRSAEPPVAQSPLRRPHREAASPFQRKALRGFQTAAGFGGTMRGKRRVHEAPPSNWIVDDPGFEEDAPSGLDEEATDILGQLRSSVGG